MTALVSLAAILRRKALQYPEQPAMYNLRGGLRIRLAKFGIYWKLRLARDNAPPSETEISVIRRDFDVPDHAYRVNQSEGIEFAVQLSWPEGSIEVITSPKPLPYYPQEGITCPS
jgi:hypothetical protein